MKEIVKKLSFAIMAVFAVFMISVSSFAQEVVIPTNDFIMMLLESIGGMKGASTLAIVFAVVQILLKFLNTELFGKWFKDMKGSTKLTIVLALTMISGVLSLMTVGGLTLGAALLHSTTLASFSVLANQLYKQFVVKED